jgi:hypothetical protein
MVIVAMFLVWRVRFGGQSCAFKQPTAGNSHPALIEINCDVSGKIRVVAMWSALVGNA